jgi:Saccharopine dehydrogenase NADP binding domain
MRKPTIGIVGACGGIGSNTARELARHGDLALILGGLSGAELDGFAATLPGRPDTRVVDARDRASAGAFCDGCDIVINCSRYSDGFAEAVFDAGCHLVDTTAFRYERWEDRGATVRSRERVWITHAGWIPGLPEVIAAYAEAEAQRRFGDPAEVDVFVYDCNEWRGYGLLDVVGGEFYGPGVLDRLYSLFGKSAGRTAARDPAESPDPVPLFDTPAQRGPQVRLRKRRLVKLPRPAGWNLVVTTTTLEQRRRIFLAYEPALLAPLLTAFWYGTTRSEDWLAEHVVGPAFRRLVERRGVAEVVHARARTAAGRSLEVSFVETRRNGYWICGIVPATAARLIAQGRIRQHGITTLDGAVDPFILADELSRVGVEFRAEA